MRRAHSVFFSLAMAVSGVGATASAQTPLTPQSESGPDIVVTAAEMREMAQNFAGAVAVAPPAEDQYARWNNRLCPSVAGLSAPEAQTLIDHIALRANDVGLTIEPSGCRPNLVIVFAPNSDQLAREIVDTRRDLLGYFSDDDVVTAGREALEAFANTPRAVRWWHVSQTVTADGQVLNNTRSRTGRGTQDAVAASQGNTATAATAGNGFSGVEAVRSRGTRFRRDTRQDLNFALVIVDARRIAGLPSEAVSDYVAMATLVQLDPSADMSAFPTVLNLFEDGNAPSGMTDWDRAYLRGLYSATREAANSQQQRREIARRIVDNLATQ